MNNMTPEEYERLMQECAEIIDSVAGFQGGISTERRADGTIASITRETLWTAQPEDE